MGRKVLIPAADKILVAPEDPLRAMTFTATNAVLSLHDERRDLRVAGYMVFASLPPGSREKTFALTITNGHEDANADFSRTAISMVLRREIDACLSYVFQSDFGSEEGASVDGEAQWYGLTHYLYYQMSPTTELGMRVEWFNDRDNARVLGIADGSATGEDYGAVTLGLNWQPCANVRLRPELRWDVSNVRPPFGAGGMFDGFTSRNQFLAAVDMIWHF